MVKLEDLEGNLQDIGDDFCEIDDFTLPAVIPGECDTANSPKDKISSFGEMQNADEGGKLMNDEEMAEGFMTNEESSFLVGDFVWGKIKPNDPWWPGQIYNPNDASDCALKIKQENRMLVAYFGYGTFSWSTASELKSFEGSFEEMVKQTNSNSFVNALNKALDEYSKSVEEKLICACVPKENLGKLQLRLAENVGIKDGVFVPEARIVGVSSALMWPETCLALLKKIAVDISSANLLDFTVLKSRLSAFYRCKLKICQEPQLILGHDNETVLKPRGPWDDDFYSQTGRPRPIVKKKEISKIGIDDSQKLKSDGDGVNLKSHTRRRIKVTNERLRAPMMIPRIFPSVENGETQTETKEENNNSETESKTAQDTETLNSFSRQRKKSRYLSYPYTDLSPGRKNPARVAEKKKSTKRGCEETLAMIRAAAINPMEKGSLDQVSGFVSSFRSSVLNGADHEIYNEGQQTSVADFNYIKEKLELMSKMVEDSEVPNPRLAAEMKDLLGKVSDMAAKEEE